MIDGTRSSTVAVARQGRRHRSRAHRHRAHRGRAGVEQRPAASHERRAGRHDVVDEHDPAAGDRRASPPRSRRTRPRRWRRDAAGRAGTAPSVARVRTRASTARQAQLAGPRPRRSAPPGRSRARAGVPRGRGRGTRTVAARARARRQRAATRLPERLREAPLTGVLERVERPARRAGERRAPLELEEGIRRPPASPSGVPGGSDAGTAMPGRHAARRSASPSVPQPGTGREARSRRRIVLEPVVASARRSSLRGPASGLSLARGRPRPNDPTVGCAER